MRHVLVVACLAVVACRSVAAPDPSSERAAPGVARAPAAAASVAAWSDGGAREASVAEAPLPPLDWGTRPPASGVLFPIVDGMCIHARVFALANATPLLVYGQGIGPMSRGAATTAAVVGPRGLAPMAGRGKLGELLQGSPTFVGGSYPDHLFAIFDASTRMTSASVLAVGSAEDAKWDYPIHLADESDPFLKVLGDPVADGEGGWLVPEQYGKLAPSLSELAEPRYRFRRVGADGKLVSTGKLPGADLAHATFQGSAARLASGEVIGAESGGTKLVRWSPVKLVDDLHFPGLTKNESGKAVVRAGRTHAWIQLGKRLFVYDGARVDPAKSAAGDAWAVLPDDSVLVVDGHGGTTREGVDGKVVDAPAPAAGPSRLFAKDGEVWLAIKRQGPRGSEALFRLVNGAWEAVPLPEPPYGNDTRSPLDVDDVTIVGPGDVFVNVRRVEKGLGWRVNEPYRAIYRTKRPDEVLRCMDVRHDDTGTGLWSWPPSADASCKTPVVTVLTEAGKTPAKDYPDVRAKLRGKTEWGSSLAFMNVEGRGYTNLVVAMDDVAKARAMATYLSKSLDLRADVVCGKPTPVRTLTFDVAKGTFATP